MAKAPHPTAIMNPILTSRWPAALALLVALLHPSPAPALVPEPDNIFFGTITRDGALVTAADFDVVVEARRTLNGPAIARYTMGSNARLGNLYSLRVKLESLTPLAAADATQTGERIHIVVTDYNGDRFSTNVTIAARGSFRQLDLGSQPSFDADNDGLPDAWELAHFGHRNGHGNTVGGNGQTLLHNYLTGSDPNNPGDQFRLSIDQNENSRVTSFFARQAAGPGYEGLSRIYALEYSTNAGSGGWFPVPDRTNILGNNATFRYTIAETVPNAVYRGRVRLQRQ